MEKLVGFYGLGHYLPSKKVSNEEIIEMNQLKIRPYFVETSVGIESRYFADDQTATSDLATAAARQALENANLSIDQI